MIEINDFKKIEDVPQEVIEKYESVISYKIIEFWKRYGLGTFFDGFMKSINPEEYTDLMGYGTQFPILICTNLIKKSNLIGFKHNIYVNYV